MTTASSAPYSAQVCTPPCSYGNNVTRMRTSFTCALCSVYSSSSIRNTNESPSCAPSAVTTILVKLQVQTTPQPYAEDDDYFAFKAILFQYNADTRCEDHIDILCLVSTDNQKLLGVIKSQTVMRPARPHHGRHGHPLSMCTRPRSNDSSLLGIRVSAPVNFSLVIMNSKTRS